MRNTFQKFEGEARQVSAFDTYSGELADSPDQFAIVWNAAGEVVIASPHASGQPGSFGMDVTRLRSDHDLVAEANKRRRDAGLGPLSSSTKFLTTVNEFSERTRILALDGERLGLEDEELLEWLINAEKQMLNGTDNHPVFETALEETACSVQRLPNGQISMTEVPRPHVDVLASKLRSLSGAAPPARTRKTIETPLRCAARYFLTATDTGRDTLRPGKGTEVTAILLLARAGYSFGLWSPQAGLFSEYAFLAPDEVRRDSNSGVRSPEATVPAGAQALTAYIKLAFDQLILQMSLDKLHDLQLTSYSQVVWGSERGLAEVTGPIAAEFAERTGLEFVALDAPIDEAVAGGLLLGSFDFGAGTVAGAEIVPTINLAHDLLAAADTEEIERSRAEEARIRARRDRAVMTMVAAPVLVTAFLLALVANLLVSNFMTSWRESNAVARTEELRPALERRRSYESNLKWYQEFITEVSQLRRQQPVGIGLLTQLDANYPLAADPAFYVSDMKLTPVGDLEMKGLARSKDAVASFLKALEFASGGESGTRLFSDLAYEVQEVGPSASQTRLPALAGSSLLTGTSAAPGVVVWSIRGNYVPVREFAPKPATAAQPAAPAAPAPKPAG